MMQGRDDVAGALRGRSVGRRLVGAGLLSSAALVMLLAVWLWQGTADGLSRDPTWSVVLTEDSIPGQFNDPVGVALDRAGNVYVADSGNGRIQVLSPSGDPIRQIGVHGDGPGQFRRPTGVALDDAGNVFVADTGNQRAQKLAPDGTPLAQWGTKGTGVGQFRAPYGIAVDSQGDAYVTDPVNRSVHRISASDGTLSAWVRPRGYEIIHPFGVAIGPDGTVYLSHAHVEQQCLDNSVGGSSGPFGAYCRARRSSVGVYTRDGEWIRGWSRAIPNGGSGAEFEDVRALAVDSRGEVYVGDGGRSCVLKLNPYGLPLPWAPKAAVPCPTPSSANILPGQTPLPSGLGSHVRVTGMAVDRDSSVYVADATGQRIVKLESEGGALAAWNLASPRQFATPPPTSSEPRRPEEAFDISYIAVDAEENLYAAIRGRMDVAVVRRFSATGKAIPSWGLEETGSRNRPGRIRVDRHGSLYTAEGGEASHVGPFSTIRRHGPHGDVQGWWGTSSHNAERILPPGGFAVDQHGTMYVAPWPISNGSIQKVLASGEIVAEWDPAAIVRAGGYTSTQPYGLQFSAITVDDRGHVYLLNTRGDVVVKLTDEGTLVGVWQVDADRAFGFGRSVGIAADRDGNVYVAHRAGSRVLKLSPNGELLAEWEPGSEPGQFADPGDITTDPHGNAYVVDAGNKRVQKLTVANRRAGR